MQMTEGFFGQILLTSGRADQSDGTCCIQNEGSLAVIHIVLFARRGGKKGEEIVLTMKGKYAIILKVLSKCWCSSVGRASHS